MMKTTNTNLKVGDTVRIQTTAFGKTATTVVTITKVLETGGIYCTTKGWNTSYKAGSFQVVEVVSRARMAPFMHESYLCG